MASLLNSAEHEGVAAPQPEALSVLLRTLEHTPLPCWVCDATTGRILAANRAAGECLGWSCDAMLERRMADLWCDGPGAERELRAALSERRLASWRQRTADGSALVVEVAVSSLDTADRHAYVLFATRIAELNSDAMGADLRRLSAVLDHTPDGVSLVAGDGSNEYVSAGAGRVLGWSVEELTRIPAGEFTHPDDVARVRPLYQELLAEPGGTRTFRSRVRHKSGYYRWIESSVTNLLHRPEVNALVAFYRDVTENVEARDELLRAQKRTEYILSATRAITYTCEAAAPFGATFISENVRNTLGLSPEEFTRNPSFWADHIHPDDRDSILAGVAKIFEHGHLVHEYRFARGDGTYCWIHDDVVLVRDENGAPREMIGCMLDVTARREAEEARQRSETSFRSLIEQLPLGVLVNRGGRIAYSNPALLDMLGYSSPAELEGRSPMAVVAPAHRETVAQRTALLEAAPIGTRNPPAEREFIRADGSSMFVEVEALRLLFDGAPALVTLVRDLREHRELLARMAASDRLAAMGTLAAGVAHEINNPLAFVLSNIGILHEELAEPGSDHRKRRAGPADLRMLLRDARDGASRIRAVVNDLRLLSHPGTQAVDAGPVDVGDVVSSCLRIASREITARARLRVSLGKALRVNGDSPRLAQVVLNLLLNAAQALPEGHADDHEVRVSTFRTASSHVIIEVTDSGCGIPREALGRIFDPFFTTKPVGIGTGLGLSISRSVLQSMGGQITVETEVGRGSIFRVALPALDSPAPTSAGDSEAWPVARRRVLVIDDERALVDSLRILLSEFHDVESTTSAKDAVARVESGLRYDVILCDIMMPQLDGMAFYTRLQEIAPDLARRVAFLTGGAFTPASREFLERVPNPCIEKPFDLTALLRLIERVTNP